MKYIVQMKHRSEHYIHYVRHYPSCSTTNKVPLAAVLTESEALEAMERLQTHNPAFLLTMLETN